jgi:hypothetical protein
MVIEYKELYCNACGCVTSHVTVDTVEGPKWQCEVCGEYSEEHKCE